MTNPKVAIVNGNRIVAAWYGSQIYEINVATGVIQGAPAIPSQPWDEPASDATQVPIEARPSPVVEATPVPTPTPFIVKPSDSAQTTATFNILFGVFSSLLISLVMIVMVVFRGRH
jgi:hypothetical protein